MTERSEKTDQEVATKRLRSIAAAVAAVVVLVVGTVLIVGNESDPETDLVATTPPTTAAAPTTTPPATTAPPTTIAAPTTTTPPPTTTQPAVTTPPQVVEVRIEAGADECRYEGPDTMNVGDTVEITLANDTDQHLIVDVYRFRGDGSTDDLPGLAATPELAYDERYEFGNAEVWLWTPPNTEGGQLYDDFSSTQPADEPFILEFDRDYGFICWSAPGQVADITSGVAAADGFTVEG